MYLVGALLIVVAIQAAAIVALRVRAALRTRAERALRDTEERFRLMVDRAPVIIWSARPDTTLDYVNGTCVEFTGGRSRSCWTQRSTRALGGDCYVSRGLPQ